MKEEVPKAKKQGTTALRDDLPDLIDDIAVSIDTDRPKKSAHDNFDHGRLRATFENYTLSDVVREYRVLMQVLLDVVDQQGTVSISDRDKIIFLVTRAIEEASEVFYQTRQEQNERAQGASGATSCAPGRGRAATRQLYRHCYPRSSQPDGQYPIAGGYTADYDQ